MKIHVHIERLVLNGLPVERSAAPQIELAMQQELASLLTTAAPPSSVLSAGAIPTLRVAPITIAERTPSRTIGAAIARSLHGGLSQ